MRVCTLWELPTMYTQQYGKIVRCDWRNVMNENFDNQLAAQEEPLKAAVVELVKIPSVCNEGAWRIPVRPSRRPGTA